MDTAQFHFLQGIYVVLPYTPWDYRLATALCSSPMIAAMEDWFCGLSRILFLSIRRLFQKC